MDEHAAWNGWLLRHGRLADALAFGLVWFGLVFLPAVVYLLGNMPGNGSAALAGAGALCAGVVGVRYLLGPGHPASGASVPWTVSSGPRRRLLALGLALGAGLLAALIKPPVLIMMDIITGPAPNPDLARRLLAGGLSALWTGACVLALVPLGPPPPRPAPPLPWTGERIMGVGVLLLGVAVLRFAAVGFRFLGPPPFDPSFLLGIIGGALLWGGLARWRHERAGGGAPRG